MPHALRHRDGGAQRPPSRCSVNARAGRARHRQLALDGVAVDARGAERDRLPAEHLGVDGLADLAAVLVGQRLDPAVALAHLQRARVGGQLERAAVVAALPAA